MQKLWKKEVNLYQFPMGKVKLGEEMKYMKAACVSIPYGKGKVSKKREDPQEEKVYQFPMGKVKRSKHIFSWKS